MRFLAFIALFLVAACEIATSSAPPVTTAAHSQVSRAVQLFDGVVKRVTPVAFQECRARRPNTNCNFRIVVDDRTNVPAIAFQTIDEQGRPLIVFTLPLLLQARNADELAFVLGHETAHHIEGHIAQSNRRAAEGAVIGTIIAASLGLGSAEAETLQQQGAFIGSRRFSKSFELEADALGTVITHRAGYDPVRGAAFFGRIPDPGNKFLGTHPPNADRIATVRRVAASL